MLVGLGRRQFSKLALGSHTRPPVQNATHEPAAAGASLRAPRGPGGVRPGVPAGWGPRPGALLSSAGGACAPASPSSLFSFVDLKSIIKLLPGAGPQGYGFVGGQDPEEKGWKDGDWRRSVRGFGGRENERSAEKGFRKESKYKRSGVLGSSPRTALWPLISRFLSLSPLCYKEAHRPSWAAPLGHSEGTVGQAS